MSGVYKGQTGFKFKGRHFRVFGVFVFEFLGSSFSSFWVLRFRDLGASFSIGASFSRFRYFVFEFWVLRFRDLAASCFGLRFRVLRFPNSPYIDSCLNLSTMATASKACLQLPK